MQASRWSFFDVKCFSFLCFLFALGLRVDAQLAVFALLDFQLDLPVGRHVLQAVLKPN